MVGRLDAVQWELGEGPAMSVLAGAPADGMVVVEDLAGAEGERWPRFRPCALDAGDRSTLSVLLEVDRTPCAALNLYAARPGVFGARARHAVGVLAMNAGMLLLGVRHAAQLNRAIDTRDVIGRAKGVLMERFGLDDAAAFARLADASQHTNIKLVDVARWIDQECRGASREAGRAPRSPDLHIV